MACFTKAELAALPRTTDMLEIGVGQQPVWPFSQTLDVNPRSRANHIHDLTTFPYPFEDDAFDVVVAEHVLEHLPELVPVLDELHRIIRPTGELRIEVPHYTSHHYWTDPTHRTPFGVRTLDYFVPTPHGGGVYQFHYSHHDWRQVTCRLNGPTNSAFQRRLTRYFDDHQHGYEARVAPMFQRTTINFVMQPIK